MRSLLFAGLVLMAWVVPALARTAYLYWDYTPTIPAAHRGFVLDACQVTSQGCQMRQQQRMAAAQRRVVVEVRANKPRCFEVVTIAHNGTRSAPSNRLCLS